MTGPTLPHTVRLHSAAWLSTLASAALLSACAQPLGAAGVHPTGPGAAPLAASPAALVQITGLLTRKGPDLGGWWAVTTDDGTAWRVDLTDSGVLPADWAAAQNARIRVRGTRQGQYLAHPIIRPSGWERVSTSAP